MKRGKKRKKSNNSEEDDGKENHNPNQGKQIDDNNKETAWRLTKIRTSLLIQDVENNDISPAELLDRVQNLDFDVKQRCYNHNRTLLMALACNKTLSTLPVLRCLMGKVEKQDLLEINELEDGNTILHYAAIHDNTNLIHVLLEAPPIPLFIWQKDEFDQYATMRAAEHGNTSALRMLQTHQPVTFSTNRLLFMTLKGCVRIQSAEPLRVLVESPCPFYAKFKARRRQFDMLVLNEGPAKWIDQVHEWLHIAELLWKEYIERSRLLLLSERTELIAPLVDVILAYARFVLIHV